MLKASVSPVIPALRHSPAGTIQPCADRCFLSDYACLHTSRSNPPLLARRHFFLCIAHPSLPFRSQLVSFFAKQNGSGLVFVAHSTFCPSSYSCSEWP